jgi:hypothetical protein
MSLPLGNHSMRIQLLALAVCGVALSGCGGGGVSTPQALRGVWGDACPAGEIQIDEAQFHVLYPKREDFDLTASAYDGKNLSLSFLSDGKKTTDVYVYDGKSLLLDHVILENGTFNSDKTPLAKCS